MRAFTLDSTGVARALARANHEHACEQCLRPMWVRYDSGLCVYCYNSARGIASVVDQLLDTPELTASL